MGEKRVDAARAEIQRRIRAAERGWVREPAWTRDVLRGHLGVLEVHSRADHGGCQVCMVRAPFHATMSIPLDWPCGTAAAVLDLYAPEPT